MLEFCFQHRRVILTVIEEASPRCPKRSLGTMVPPRTCFSVIFILLAFSFVHEVHGEEEKTSKKKLQIGVKKRVDNCQVKSKKGDFLHMHYKGTLEDGTEFDSSYGRGQPLTFTLGSAQVIKGWDQGLMGMCEGEKRKLVIPPELGYGSTGAPPKIPGDATLIFEVELVKIERRDDL